MSAWTILTCEYPPDGGGVANYTAQVAGALAAAGDEVTVICPPRAEAPAFEGAVRVLELEDTYGRSSRARIDRHLGGGHSTVLVQYVPTAFGMSGGNLPFCHWLLGRAHRHGDDVRVMFHEPYFEFGWTPIYQSPLSLAQRAMARMLLRASRQTYLSTDAWRRYLSPYVRGGTTGSFLTLPIPSAIPRCESRDAVDKRRVALTSSAAGALLGHFGTYGAHVAPMLRHALIALLTSDLQLTAVCIGGGSDEFVRDLAATVPDLDHRVRATGRVPAQHAAEVLAACDLLLQPYPDGVTTRRTSVMAGLINTRPVVTTAGYLTEPVWAETNAVAMARAGDGEAFVAAGRLLLSDVTAREALGRRGATTYAARFALEHTIDALRRSVEGAAA
jgi:glycosyltransferase involved in cell wall biosynthesis